ncbi:MAG TPA: DUF5666 domain-containing protein [Bryobacteraceae bacterium]|nr:DUF5666 domain-containing protein [Bryobacteraceae bacterium]
MIRLPNVLFLTAITLCGVSAQQNPAQSPSQKTAPVNDKFSGTVTDLTADSLTVVRAVPAKDAVTRKFTLDAQTKVEGKLRLKARVTVQYASPEDGQFRAVHIIVR